MKLKTAFKKALMATLTTVGFGFGGAALAQQDAAPQAGSVVQDGSVYVSGELIDKSSLRDDNLPENYKERSAYFDAFSKAHHDPYRLYAARADEPQKLSWYAAKKSCAAKTDGGHADWRLPNEEELAFIMNKMDQGALKGSFKEEDYNSGRMGWGVGYGYWAVEQYSATPISQEFVTGRRDLYASSWYEMNVRCVRTEPMPARDFYNKVKF